MRYPADPPTVEEIVAVMRHSGEHRHGWRLRALIVVLWRGGLRIHEALALAELDLDPRRGSLLVRNGKGGKRRELGMNEWGGSGVALVPRRSLDAHGRGRGLAWSPLRELRRILARCRAGSARRSTVGWKT